MLRTELINYFERLRILRGGISQLDFIDGIISPTQYRRYLNGESKLPFRVIVALSDRLGLKYDYVLDQLDVVKNKERRLVTRLMNIIVTYNFKEFDKLVNELDHDYFIHSENKLIFDYVNILSGLLRNKVSKELTLIHLKKLIDYPNILEKKQVLSVAEFIILGEIATLVPVNEQELALNRLKKILDNPRDVIVGNNEKLVIMLLVRIIKTLGISKKYDEALFYSLKGIQISKATHTLYSLDYLYYYAALCYNQSGDINKRDDMIFLTIMAANADGDLMNAKKFKKFIEENFNLSISEFIKNRF